MDHLPCPGSAIGREKIIIPYVCQEEYDGGPFMTYPSRIGLPDLHTVGLFPGQFPYSHQGEIGSLPKRDLESFYQTWLFFGLIHEILGKFCAPEDSIYTCGDQHGYTRAISTSKFVPALDEWVAEIQAGRPDPSVTYAHVARCLCMTNAALSIQAIRSSLDPNLKLSLASLGQSFMYAANKAFNITNPAQDNKCPMTWCRLIDDNYWKRRFLEYGWCVAEIQPILDTTLSLQTLHFLACLDKTNMDRDHQRCDLKQCRAYQNDLDAYQTQHLSKNCQCEELIIDSTNLHNILITKALPLIRVRRGQTLEELSVDVVASQPTSRYVALSHVWADGLGNPQGNALPRCQISNLGKIIQDLDIAAGSRDVQNPSVKGKDVKEEVREEDELLLWCDTLCCPVQTEEAKHLALEYMYQTYQNAAHVLVLDASLRRYNVENVDIDEVSMRVLTSPWMRRLWTLQEGALPAVTNRISFQLAHKALNLGKLRLNAYDNYSSSIGRKGLAADMLLRLASFANVFPRDSSTHPRADLVRVMHALHRRSVSVSSDEPLLIGNLLGLDAAQILNGGDGTVAQRMNRLWRLLPSAVNGIPSDILFLVGPRLAEPGLRWAPATLLIDKDVNTAIQSNETGYEQGILTPSDGLSVYLHGFRISVASSVKGQPFLGKVVDQLKHPNAVWMKDNDGSWYQISRSLPVDQDNFLTDKTVAEVMLNGKDLWVIHRGPEFPRPPNSTVGASAGLIVEVEPGGRTEEERTAVNKARAKLHIIIGPLRSISAQLALANEFSAQLVANSPTLQRLAAIAANLDERSSSSSPSPKTIALEGLGSEIHQMATSEEAKKAAAADGTKLNIPLMEHAISTILWGQYVCMGEKVPKSQPWCVD